MAEASDVTFAKLRDSTGGVGLFLLPHSIVNLRAGALCGRPFRELAWQRYRKTQSAVLGFWQTAWDDQRSFSFQASRTPGFRIRLLRRYRQALSNAILAELSKATILIAVAPPIRKHTTRAATVGSETYGLLDRKMLRNRARRRPSISRRAPFHVGRAIVECGFNRSMQHTEDCMSEECCCEAKTADLLHGQPENVNVGTLAERRIASEDRPDV
ncbi:hypothetical protein K6W76_01305 [Burkholderia anthina]|uniref:hypothetical protein n=1 Tax=Burkholderia anthina TaxID=179879 RepID=UPI00158E2392|nr:hypothetical protein [Burkholderia anthina]MBY4865157.1 hypothetical protein [Burkholderia anthina]